MAGRVTRAPGNAVPRHEITPEPVRRSHGAEVVLLAAAVMVLGLLCYSIYPALSPFVLCAGFVFLLYPFRRDMVALRLMQLGVLLFAFWFFSTILGLLAPFIIAFILAYIFNPVVVRLERRRVPRWASAAGLVLLLLGAVVAVGLFVVPVAVEQGQTIIGRAGALADDVTRWIGSGAIADFLGKFGVSGEKARDILMQNLTPKLEEMLRRLFEGLFGVLVSVTSLAHQLLNIIIIPFVLFYLLIDFPAVMQRCAMFVPERNRARVVELAGKGDAIIGRYFRGAIMVAAIQGTIAALLLSAIGVDYAIILGLMTAVLNFIPYVGLAVSLVVSSIVALLSAGAVGTKVTLVVVMYLGQKLLEATVLGPKILGRQVGLHPVLLILCLLVFGFFLGFVGLLIAVPATALIIAAAREWDAARKERRGAVRE